jgi:apolipoprotein D and lipocalin family protein
MTAARCASHLAWRFALTLSTGLSIGLSHAAPAALQTAPLQPIAQLDLPRYMGTWYELARYPNRFQRGCEGGTSATYALQSDATVRVTNRCRAAQGGIQEAVGQARRTGRGESATLQVRFAPAWLSWLPFVWGTYWVVDLDAGYQLAVVSEPSREYLWVLSRTPQISPVAWEAVTQRLTQLGFEPQRLVREGP